MKLCFAPSTPMPAARSAQSSAVCSRPAAAHSAQVRMAAGGSTEKPGLMEWLYNKMMHNSDAVYGYEPFFVEAMQNRDAEKRKAYEEEEKENRSS